MTARTHDIFALASLVTVSVYYPPQHLNLATLFAAMVACVVGSLAPDMDQGTNRLWNLLPGGDFLGKIFRRLFLGHRSLSHSLLGIYIFYQGLSWLLPKFLNAVYIDSRVVLAAVMTGIISHLVADGLTEEGLPLLFPFNFKIGFPPVSSWRIKTGHWFEKFVVFPGILIYLFYFISTHQTRLVQILRLVTN
ncbi:MAG: Membrane protein containing DUF457, transmembrane [Candidatus Amesbacteria bacterium GW2011_GWB1_47_19]|nr:MAG: Membrane protein containing DUF457, transmembrane [Candidatus Amesbacteria bacterium GW2011_GWA1_44_24]KKU31343.1 MAG: Membrane protein containing DUF457, transmembrane [Candidatus Amesbacteria bacterium GW2011_GWC1_46_24]KKU67004.1 MAG: Membrane protein containing DUF457, transmembrane [Candidatus Amesbacteria bacterium GW2011_GWB1_47_19]OGD04834.1 MAG: hypothetical protein A2379_04690 [Candidatus Amesbacteria bacterium RIFOXYB1_FULL_47_13]HBC72776.1 hypothetical protein [Candidatus Am